MTLGLEFKTVHSVFDLPGELWGSLSLIKTMLSTVYTTLP